MQSSFEEEKERVLAWLVQHLSEPTYRLVSAELRAISQQREAQSDKDQPKKEPQPFSGGGWRLS